MTGQAGIKDICCRQSPKCFEHPWAQTAREVISKTQFYKPGPGMLAPGGARGSAPWYWQYPSVFQQRRNMLDFSTDRKKDSQKNMVFSFVLHITDKKKIVKA